MTLSSHSITSRALSLSTLSRQAQNVCIVSITLCYFQPSARWMMSVNKSLHSSKSFSFSLTMDFTSPDNGLFSMLFDVCKQAWVYSTLMLCVFLKYPFLSPILPCSVHSLFYLTMLRTLSCYVRMSLSLLTYNAPYIILLRTYVSLSSNLQCSIHYLVTYVCLSLF